MHHPLSRKCSRKVRSLGFAVLLISGLVLLASCELPGSGTTSQNPTPTPVISVPTPTPMSAQPIDLQDMHMLDAMDGWAIASNSTQVLETTSGGARWQIAQVSTGLQSYTLKSAAFLDSQNAWVAVQSADKYSVFYTFNGGGLWAETPILDEQGNITHITFADALNGWFIFDKGQTATGDAIDLFQTTDGGNSWLPIATTDNTTGGQIPYNAAKTGLTFLNATTGWLTGGEPGNGHAWLYMTENGGTTWIAQTLSLPSTNMHVSTFPPTFFSTTDGILPVVLSTGSSTQLDIYATHNGGRSWQSTASTANLNPAVSFIDSNHGWTMSNNNNGSLYSTSDGGKHWAQISAKLASNVTSISEIDFVSSTHGWAIAATAAKARTLFQTTNGGKTWTLVHTFASA